MKISVDSSNPTASASSMDLKKKNIKELDKKMKKMILNGKRRLIFLTKMLQLNTVFKS